MAGVAGQYRALTAAERRAAYEAREARKKSSRSCCCLGGASKSTVAPSGAGGIGSKRKQAHKLRRDETDSYTDSSSDGELEIVGKDSDEHQSLHTYSSEAEIDAALAAAAAADAAASSEEEGMDEDYIDDVDGEHQLEVQAQGAADVDRLALEDHRDTFEVVQADSPPIQIESEPLGTISERHRSKDQGGDVVDEGGDGEDLVALRDIAKAHRHKGNWEVAVLSYTEAVNFGQQLLESASKTASTDEVEAEATAQLLESLARCHNERGMCFGQLGRHPEACTDYDEAAALDPSEAVYFYNRGNAHSALGALHEAAADFKQALEVQPGFKEAHLALAQARTEKSNCSSSVVTRTSNESSNFWWGAAVSQIGQVVPEGGSPIPPGLVGKTLVPAVETSSESAIMIDGTEIVRKPETGTSTQQKNSTDKELTAKLAETQALLERTMAALASKSESLSAAKRDIKVARKEAKAARQETELFKAKLLAAEDDHKRDMADAILQAQADHIHAALRHSKKQLRDGDEGDAERQRTEKRVADLRAELEDLRVSQLRKRALSAGGITQEEVDDADDSETPKVALISLIVRAECDMSDSSDINVGGTSAGTASVLMLESAGKDIAEEIDRLKRDKAARVDARRQEKERRRAARKAAGNAPSGERHAQAADRAEREVRTQLSAEDATPPIATSCKQAIAQMNAALAHKSAMREKTAASLPPPPSTKNLRPASDAAEREARAIAVYNEAVRQRAETSKANTGTRQLLNGRPIAQMSGKSSAALGKLLQQRTATD